MRQTAAAQIVGKKSLVRGEGAVLDRQLLGFGKGEGEHLDLNISARDQRRKFSRKQLGVAAGDIDVTVYVDEQRGRHLFPFRDRLYLVEQDIHLALCGTRGADQKVVQDVRVLELGVRL